MTKTLEAGAAQKATKNGMAATIGPTDETGGSIDVRLSAGIVSDKTTTLKIVWGV